jgi:hypothetical protein
MNTVSFFKNILNFPQNMITKIGKKQSWDEVESAYANLRENLSYHAELINSMPTNLFGIYEFLKSPLSMERYLKILYLLTGKIMVFV